MSGRGFSQSSFKKSSPTTLRGRRAKPQTGPGIKRPLEDRLRFRVARRSRGTVPGVLAPSPACLDRCWPDCLQFAALIDPNLGKDAAGECARSFAINSRFVLTAATVFFIGLGAPKLWDEDEPEYARCTQEMMHRGDLIVPTFNGHLWTDKPVLLYWMMMGSFSLFGATEFAARFPCALLAIGTALMTYHLGRRLFRPQVGLWAGLIVATTASFAVVGRAACARFAADLLHDAFAIDVCRSAWATRCGMAQTVDRHSVADDPRRSRGPRLDRFAPCCRGRGGGLWPCMRRWEWRCWLKDRWAWCCRWRHLACGC